MSTVDEFAYPPRVQEAIDLVNAATKDYERRERQAERERRQAACPHENIDSVSAATMEDFTATLSWCADCGAKQAA
jgi:regulator of protease activity HflC (stomatin/prohibitin superfamily)